LLNVALATCLPRVDFGADIRTRIEGNVLCCRAMCSAKFWVRKCGRGVALGPRHMLGSVLVQNFQSVRNMDRTLLATACVRTTDQTLLADGCVRRLRSDIAGDGTCGEIRLKPMDGISPAPEDPLSPATLVPSARMSDNDTCLLTVCWHTCT